jgi:hypothetical protein
VSGLLLILNVYGFESVFEENDAEHAEKFAKLFNESGLLMVITHDAIFTL